MNLDENQQVAKGSRNSFEIRLTTTSGSVVNMRFLRFISANALSKSLHSDIRRWVEQGSAGGDPAVRARGELARNVLQLVMRQGPNRFVQKRLVSLYLVLTDF